MGAAEVKDQKTFCAAAAVSALRPSIARNRVRATRLGLNI
jgi:hypothetical protein